MSRTRGAANRSLYRARIILEAWAREEAGGHVPAQDLMAAFLPAARAHLLEAYGWFLLAVTGREDVVPSSILPRSVMELPEPEPGRERPPELREFARLEHDSGWLAELLDDALAASAGEATVSAPARNLLGSDRPTLSQTRVEAWLENLGSTMQRMDDSLAES